VSKQAYHVTQREQAKIALGKYPFSMYMAETFADCHKDDPIYFFLPTTFCIVTYISVMDEMPRLLASCRRE
jgi:3-isopropylmalate dehydratase small subunit